MKDKTRARDKSLCLSKAKHIYIELNRVFEKPTTDIQASIDLLTLKCLLILL